MAGSPHYIWEKLFISVMTLATVDAPLRERLDMAWGQFSRLLRDDFDQEVDKARFDEVHDALSDATGGAAQLDDAQAHDIAETIVSLFDDAIRRHERSKQSGD